MPSHLRLIASLIVLFGCADTAEPEPAGDMPLPRTSVRIGSVGNHLGVFDPQTAVWTLRTQRPGWNEPGNDNQYPWGTPGERPIVGDWRGEGTASLGTFRAGSWKLARGLRINVPDAEFVFGAEGDTPVVGDWNGDGSTTAGVFRDGKFALRNSNSAGAAELTIELGATGDIPIAGDWDGDGDDTVGIYTPASGLFRLLTDNETGAEELRVPLNIPDAYPVAGDWDDDGRTTVGVRKGSEWTLLNHLRAPRSHGKPLGFYENESYSLGEIKVEFGDPAAIPVTGDWFFEDVGLGHAYAPPSLNDFFPLAIDYQDPSTFAKWKALGINTVIRTRPGMNGRPPTDAEKALWTTQANELGLKMIREPYDVPIGEEENLLAYILRDEPDVELVDPFDEIERKAEAVRAVSSRPLFVNFAGWSVLYQDDFRHRFGPGDVRERDDFYSRYIALEDWVSQDIYAISQNAAHERVKMDEADAMDAVWLTFDKLRRWAPNKPQFAFIESSQSDISRKPELTRGQFRAQIWSAIVHGVRGIFYFPHGDCGGLEPCLRDDAMTDELRAEMSKQNTLITKLASALQKEVGDGITAAAPLQVGRRSAFEGELIIAVNYSAAPIERWIRLDGVLFDKPIEVIDENRTIEAQGGYALHDSFEPYGVHIYLMPND